MAILNILNKKAINFIQVPSVVMKMIGTNINIVTASLERESGVWKVVTIITERTENGK